MLLRYTLFAAFFALGFGSLTANNLMPTAVCVDQINIAVDANCVGTITTSMIDAGSNSPWGPVYLSLDQTEFLPGTHIVTLTVQDAFSSNSCFAQLTVEDKTPPELICAVGVVIETTTPDYIEDSYSSYDLVQLVSDNCGSFNFAVSITAGNNYGPRSFTVGASDDAGNTTYCSGTVNIIPPAVPTGYCSSYGNSGYEYIESMKISTPSGTELDLVSGNNSGAAYFSAYPINFFEGEVVDFAYSPGFTGAVYAEYWRFYLDLNRDGDFDDAGELIMYDKQNRDEVRYQSITLPAAFPAYGPTRMRVVMAWRGYRGPCETGFWGEREDYLVNLEPNTTGARLAGTTGSKLAAINTKGDKSHDVDHPAVDISQLPVRTPVSETKLWPNPAKAGAEINLEVTEVSDVSTVTIRQIFGKTITVFALRPGQQRNSLMLPAALVPGIYLVSGKNDDQEIRWTKRVMVR